MLWRLIEYYNCQPNSLAASRILLGQPDVKAANQMLQ
jgi:hypothetical protein